MFSFNLSRWMKSWFTRRRGKPIVKKPHLRPAVELLEDRLAPAVYTWTGALGAANPGWNTTVAGVTNWQGNVIPTAGSDLLFPALITAAETSTDNMAGLSINSISFESGSSFGYTLTSSGATLTLGSTGSTAFINDQSGASDIISMNIAIDGSMSSTNNLDVALGTTLTFQSTLTPGATLSGTSQLAVFGGGTIVVNQANTFSGSVTIGQSNDDTIVEMMNSTALGNASNPVIVENNAEIQVSGNVTANYNVTLNGFGNAGSGGFDSSPLMSTGGNNVWNGNINFVTNANADMYMDVSAAGTTFTINGVISDSGTSAPGALYDLGNGGELILSNANQYHGETDIYGELAIEDPLALGPSDTQQVYTHSDSIRGTGTLLLEYTGASITNVTDTLTPTITTSAANTFVAGQQITIANVLGATGVNGTWVIASILSPTTFTIHLSSLPGAYTSGGSVTPPYTGTSPYILTNPNAAQSSANPYVGFVVDYQLESLLGVGFGGNGALYNFAGDNAWSGVVNLDTGTGVGSDNIKVAAGSELDITGVIGDRTGMATEPLDKIGTGDLILEPTVNAANLPADSYALITLNDGTTILSQDGANSNSSQGTANTFTDPVLIQAGIVTLEDSQGLGESTSTAQTTVSSGASLHLVANVGHQDSLTGTSTELLIDAPLSISGVGATAVDEGALDSISGINTYTQNPNYTQGGAVKDIITIASAGTYIGVDPDPLETANNTYFSADYSLTINGGLINSNAGYSNATWIDKVGDGQLILPNSNLDFYGSWEIKQGWITVQDEYSLGGSQNGLPPNFPQGAFFNTQVDSGAALMLLPFNPNSNMSLGDTNLILRGDGITHAFSLIDDMGALENLAGVNSVQGNITLEGQVGIGVEEIYPGVMSDLTFSGGEVTQAEPTALYNMPSIPASIAIPNTLAAGGVSQYTQIIDTGSTSFTGTINYASFIGDEIQVYYGPIGTPGSHVIASTAGVITSAAGTLAFNDTAAVGDSTEIEIVVDQDDPTETLSATVSGVSVTNLSSTSQLYAGELVSGTGIPTGDTIASINANGTALTLTNAATGSPSQLTFGNSTWSYSGSVTVNAADFVGGIIKLGSQRLVLEGAGIYEGGVDIRAGVVLDENETALGQPEFNSGTAGQMFGTTVEAGAGLMLAPTLATLDGGLTVGPSTWDNHLTLNGTGNAAFGVAPLTVLSDDNLWSGPISLNAAVSITYQGPFADTALPASPVSVNFSGLTGGTDPTIDDATTSAGSASQDDVETLTFGGSFAGVGGNFTMTVYDGTQNWTTGNIAWSANPNTLIANIKQALSLDPDLSNFQNDLLFSVVSPTIDIEPNARLIVLGTIDDNSGPITGDGTASALSGGSDLYIAGGGELQLNGANTYRGTTYVNQGTLIVGNSAALGATGTSATQSIALTNAVAGFTYFTLSFNGETTGPILYSGTAADAAHIQTALGGLSDVGAANVVVTPANPGSFLVAFSGAANNGTIISPAIDVPLSEASTPSGYVSGTTIVAGIEGGTEVADNAQIQLQGGITVNGESLVVQGQGSNLEPTVQTFTLGGATTGSYSLTFGGQTANGISYAASAAQIQADLQSLSSVGGVGGQVYVTETGISGGVNDEQQIVIDSTVNNNTTFTLTFGPTAYSGNIVTTNNITYDANSAAITAVNIEKALNALPNIGGAVVGGITSVSGVLANGGEEFTITFLGGLGDTPGLPTLVSSSPTHIAVTHLSYGALPTKTYQVVFLGSFGGASEPVLTATAAAASGTTVSPPTVTVTGGSANATLDQWFSDFQGTGTSDTAIQNVQVYNGAAASSTTEDASGPVTDVLVSEADPDVIYITTAGGGAWETLDGGLTWQPLFDSQMELDNPAVMFGDVITQDPNNVNILFYGTGIDSNASDSFYGQGVYESTNGGATWNLLTDPSLGNPFAGMTISSMIASPKVDGAVVVTANYAPASVSASAALNGTTDSIVVSGHAHLVVGMTVTGPTGAGIAGGTTITGFGFGTVILSSIPTGVGNFTLNFAIAGGYGDVNGSTFGDNAGVWYYNGANWEAVLTDTDVTQTGTLDGTTAVITAINTSQLAIGMFVSGVGVPAGSTITAINAGANTITISNVTTVAGANVGLTFTDSSLGDFPQDNFSSLVFDNGGGGDADSGALMVAISSLDDTGTGDGDFGIYTTKPGVNFFTSNGPWIWSNTNTFNTGAVMSNNEPTPILEYQPVGGVDYKHSGTIMLAGNTYEVSGSQNSGSATSSYDAYYAGISAIGSATGQLFDVQWLQLESEPPAPTPPITSWTGRADALPYTNDLDNIPNYMDQAGSYANVITAYGNYVFLGGTDSANGTGFVLMSTNNGSTWSAIAVGGAAGTANGPSTSILSMEPYSLNASATPTTLYVTTDGGVWTYTIASGTWTDITGNLADAQFVSASTDPDNSNIALAAGHSVGAVNYNLNTATGAQSWSQTAGGGNNSLASALGASGNGTTSFGGQIEFDPANPALAYFFTAGTLYVSSNANTAHPTWTASLAADNELFMPFALDPNNSQRIVVGNGTTLEESLNAGASWISLSTAVGYPAIDIASVAIADFQGTYQADPSFSNVPADPSDTADPNTIYITDGSKVFVTENGGATWSGNRPPPLYAGTAIEELVVDPADAATVFAVTTGTSGTAGAGHVFESTNFGQSWTDITGGGNGLADQSVWTLAIDPRNGNLYVGTDVGVYELAGGEITATNNWVRFGAGLPNVQVRDIEINTTTNIMTIATYGRGMYQLYLSDASANAGAFTALSGNDTWTGPVTLVGPTTIAANGSQALQDGFSGATLTITGTIGDGVPGAVGNTLTKIGGGDLALAGDNTYSGVTVVSDGNLVVQNPDALGAAGVPGTQVLVLQDAVPGITQFTLSFNGASGSTAAIPYTGDGVTDAQAIMSALNNSSILPAGESVASVTADATDTMFTIVVSGAPAGAVQPLFTVSVTSGTGGGFSAEAGSTWVVAGAAIELESSLNDEPITLNGNGIQPPSNGHDTGALVNVADDHNYTGTITLNTNSTIGVTSGALTIDPAAGADGIIDGGTPSTAFSLTKEGEGSLVLDGPDAYQGDTYVTTGVLEIENDEALGSSPDTIVADGAQLELQKPSGSSTGLTIPATNTLYLSGVGAGTAVATAGALRNNSGDNTWAGPIFLTPVPNFSSATTPEGVVAIYVDPGDTLTLASTIADDELPPTPAGGPANVGSASSGLAEVGTGALILAGANTYTGGTYVGYTFGNVNDSGAAAAGLPGGTIDVQNANALGDDQNQEVQRIVTYDPPGTNPGDGFTLTFNGQTTGHLVSGASAATIQSDLNALSSIGLSATGTTAAGNAVVTNLEVGGLPLSSITQLQVGMPVTGAHIPAGETIASIQSISQITLTTGTGVTAGTNAAITLGGVTVSSATVYNGLDEVQDLTLGDPTSAQNSPASLTATAAADPGANLNPTMILSGTTANGSFNITNLPSTANLYVGEPVSGTGIPAGSTVASIVSGTAVTFTNAGGTQATGSATSALTFTQTYYYAVTAVTPLGESLPTEQSVTTGAVVEMAAGTTLHSAAVTLTAASASSLAGMLVSGPGIPLGTTVLTNAAGSTAVTLSNQATATGVNVDLTFTPASLDLAVNLSWSSVLGATSYNIYRSLNAGNFAQALLTSVGGAATSYTDLGPVSLSPPASVTATAVNGGALSGTYYYVVTAVGIAGETLASSQASATASGPQGTIDLAWSPVQGALSYNVYRSTVSGDFTDSLLASTTLTAFTDTGSVAMLGDQTPPAAAYAAPALLNAAAEPGGALASSTTYYYAVASIGPDGPSLINTYASVTTSSAAVGDLKVALTWTPADGATGYTVYRSTTPIDQADLSNDLIAYVNGGTSSGYTDTGATLNLQGTTANNNAVITDIASINLLTPGMAVSGTNIPAGAYILSVNSAQDSITISANATAAGTGALAFNAVSTFTPPTQTTFSVNFGISLQANTTAGSTTMTIATNPFPALSAGMSVSGPGIQAGTTIVSVAGTTVKLSLPYEPPAPAETGDTFTFGSPAITYTGDAVTDAAAIQAAMQNLSTIGAGNVTVSADPTDTIFTITFQGALSDEQQSLVGATVLQSTASAAVTEVTPGDGGATYIYTVDFVGGAALTPLAAQPLITVNKTSATSALTPGSSEVATGGLTTLVYTGSTLELDGDPTGVGASLTLPTSTTIALNGPGVNDEGALDNASGDNTLPWDPNSTAPTLPVGALPSIILQSSSYIGAAAGTELDVTGTVADPTLESSAEPISYTDPTALPNSLTKVGAGTVILNPAAAAGNTYTGTTNVDAGNLDIESAHALGYNTSAVQDIQVGATGSFELDFNSATLSSTINIATANAQTVQAAIDALPSIGGGMVSVTQSGDNYYVYFNNPAGAAGSDPLADVAQNLLGFRNLTGTGVVSLTTLIAGGASTTNVAATGTAATLQLENAAGNGSGFSEASGKALNLNDAGFTGDSAAINVTGTTSSGSAALTGLSNTSQLVPGMAVSGANIPAGAVIVSVDSATQVTLSAAAAGSSAGPEALAVNAVSGALENVLGANTWGSSTVTLGTNTTIGVDDTSSLTISQPIGDGGNGFGVAKLGAGTLNFTGDDTTNNTYTGTTNVLLGTLNLSKTDNGTALDGNLYVGSPDYFQQTQTLTFNNFAASDIYQLVFDGESTGPIVYAGNAGDANTIEHALNTQLALISANFSSPFSVTPVAGSTDSFVVTLGGGLNGTAWPEIRGYTSVSGASIGTVLGATAPAPAGALNSVIVNELAGSINEIVPTATVTVVDDGVLNLLLGAEQTVAELNMTSGDVVLANGSELTLAGPGLTGPLNASSDATGGAIIQDATTPGGTGELNFGANGHLFTVNHGAAASVTTDLDISVVITGSAGDAVTALTKAGDGRLELSNENTYSGLTQIDDGDVQVDSLQTQIITLGPSVVTPDAFTLTYDNPSADGSTVSASPITTSAGSPIAVAASAAATAANIQNALNQALVGSNTGPVTVSVIGSGVFSVAFAGVLGLNVIPLTLTGVTGSFAGTTIDTLSNIGNVVMDGGSLSGTGSVGAGTGVAVQVSTPAGVAVTAASWTNAAGGTATITAPGSNFSVGQTVVVSGVTPTAYDGTYTVTIASADSFSYLLPLAANPGSGTNFGAAAVIATVNPGANGPPITPGTLQTTGAADWTPTTQFSVDLEGNTQVTFQNALGDQAVPTLGFNAAGLTGMNPTMSIVTATAGNGSTNAVQSIAFGGTVTGGTFELTYNGVTTDGIGTDPAPIAWSSDQATLIANIQSALDALTGGGNTLVAHAQPVSGADYDTLFVNGNVNLGSGNNPNTTPTNLGALLTGTVGPNVAIGDSFTILQVPAGDTITGNFTELIDGVQVGIGPESAGYATDSLFIGLNKFYVTYNPTSVVLTRALVTDTVTVTPLTNPLYGQNVAYVATIVPELGAPVPDSTTNDPSASVTFTDAQTGETYTTAVVNGTATWTPQTEATTGTAMVWMAGTLHEITAAFSDASTYSVSESYPATFDGTTAVGSPTITVVTDGLGSQPLAPGMNIAGPGIPAGATIGTVNGSPTITSITLAGGAVATGSFTDVSLNVGPEYALMGTATSGSPTLTGLLSTSALTVGMSVSGTGIPAGATILSINPVAGTVTLDVNADVHATGSPTTLTFGPYWGLEMYGDTSSSSSTITGLPANSQLVPGLAVLGANIPTGTFIGALVGLRSITLVDANGMPVDPTSNATDEDLQFAQVVQKQNVTITTTLPATSVYGQPQTFTATVVSSAAAGVPGALPPSVTISPQTVSMSIDGGPAIAPISVLGQVATFILPATLNVSTSPHTITISYTGDANYNANSIAPEIAITPRGSTIAITPNPTISSVGQPATFDIQVSPVTPPAFSGNPAEGTVAVYDGNPALASTTTTAAFAIPALLAPAISIGVASTTGMSAGEYLYISDGTNSIVAYVTAVNAGASTVTIETATIRGGAAGNMMANAATVAQSGLLDPALTTGASFSIPTGVNTATVSLAGSSWIAAGEYLNISDGTNTIVALVTGVGAGTATIQTAEVLAGAGVTMNGGATVQLATNPASGLAAFTTTALAFGTHQIYAVLTDGGYTGADLDFTGGLANDNSISYTVQAGTSITNFTASPSSGDVYGQTVTLTTTVQSTEGIPTAGRVDFYDGAVDGTGSPNYLGSGTITLVTSAITSASWSSNAGGQATITLASNSYVPGQLVQISGITPSAFDGTFTILSTTATSFTYALPLAANPGSGGAGSAIIARASLTTSVLAVGTHTLSAQYNDVAPNNNYGQSPTAVISNYVVGKATSKVVVTANTPSTTITAAGGFSIPAVGSSVTTTVASTAGLAVNQYFYISDGTHTIAAQITGFGAGTSVTFQTDTLVAGSAGNTMADGATVMSNVPIYGNALTFTATVTAVSPGVDAAPTGTVTFSDSLDGSLGAGTFVAPNTWSIIVPATVLSAGTHTITATYSGDGNLTGPTNGTLGSYVIAPAGTTVSTPVLTSPLSTPVYGQPITLQATVTNNVDDPGTPGDPTTGTVTFNDGTTKLGVVTLSGSNLASLTLNTPTLAAGVNSITATYAPPAIGANFAGNASGVLSQTVNPAPTSVTVASSSQPSVGLNQAVTYTATIDTAAPSTPVPVTAGSVTFYDVSPTATVPTTTGATFTITSVGSSTGAILVSSTTGMAIGGLIEITDGTSAIVGTIASFVTNASVTVTTAAVLAGNVGGTMASGASVSAAAKLNAAPASVNAGGQASVAFTYTALSQLGAHTIWASYNPPASAPINYLGSDGDMTETVLKATAVTVSAVSDTWGQPLVYNVSVTSAQAGDPTGTVEAVETVPLTGTTTMSSATVGVPSTALLNVGMAVTGANIPANTTILSIDGTTNTVTLSNAASTTATVTLTFTGVWPGGAGLAVSGTPAESRATITIPADTLNAGAYSLVFMYSGDPNYAQSTKTVTQSVAPAATTMTIASSSTSAELRQAVTFTATLKVTPTTPAGMPGYPALGTVTFKNGTAILETVNLASPPAGVTVTDGAPYVVTIAFTTSTLTAGSHTITAVYSGSSPASPNFSASNTAGLTQAIVGDGALGALSPTAWTQNSTTPYSGAITFTRGGTVQNAMSVIAFASPAATTTSGTFVVPAVGSSTAVSVASAAGLNGQTIGIASGTNAVLAMVTNVAGNTLTIETTEILTGSAGNTMASAAGVFFDPSTTVLPGLTVSVVSGTSLKISGTPTTAGTFTPTIFVTDAVGVTVSKSYTITINPPAVVAFTPASPATGYFNTAFSATATITGGTGAYTLQPTTGGTLPPGLTVALSGAKLAISGKPTAAAVGNTYSFSINVKDAGGNVVSTPYSITIDKAPTTIALSASASTVLLGKTVTLFAVVTSSAGTPDAASPTVTFTDNSGGLGVLGTGTLIAATATTATYRLIYTFATANAASLGAHSITVSYGGNAEFAASPVSTAVAVNVVNTTLTLAATTTSPNPNQAVTFVATLTAVGGTPAGDVINFYDNGALIASVTLKGSGPTYTADLTTSFASGTNVITASFAADPAAGLDAAASGSATVTVRGLRVVG